MTNVGVDFQIERIQATGTYEFDGRTIVYTKGSYEWSGLPIQFVFAAVSVPDGAGDASLQEALP